VIRASVWLEVIFAGQAINDLVRRTGYSTETAAQVRRLTANLQHAESRSLVTQVADEIEPLGQQLGRGETMPALFRKMDR